MPTLTKKSHHLFQSLQAASFDFYQLFKSPYNFIVQAMKYPSQSAIQKHYLQAILPHPTYPIQKQILKTKEFYQPQKFIWNNPHRVSNQMYKFYHAYNENYSKYKEPLIRRQEQIDRETAQMQRIHRLIAFRNKTRDEFAKKQKNRELLESRSINDQRNTWKSVKTDQNIGIQSQYKHLAELKDEVMKKSGTKQAQKSQRIIRIENTYKQGLKKYDIKTEQISKLINNQHQDYHRHIRSEFAARKNTNDTTNIRFYSKAKKTTLYQQQEG